ncbi:hypothetical protein BOTBODRAFT_64589 [Botryobasidium botryosum FD-172 SS1]|uniref:Transmembrane protein n=1 Tax=Botryobasidium botryosum (strain FD-172 SS1) TaxID=930990 RepID=A0A067MYJ6_BOTB1|nr:hypothetical protein BOTBODRAFT_64589 [Botryobasidium botryosum FD-172 SS1]
MWSVLVVIVLLHLCGVCAQLQASTNVTCFPGSNWMINSMGQIPCLVVAYLSADCAGTSWMVAALTDSLTQSYTFPTPDTATKCRCNTVAYNLISACTVCQGHAASPWSEWSQNCPAQITTVGSYPLPVPSQTAIPGWAYWDPTPSGTFDALAAHSFTPLASQSSHSKSHVGAIVGGVVGGIAGLALVAGFLWWLFRRRNAKRAAANHPNMSQVTLNVKPLKPYDPNDPSTFPTTPTDNRPASRATTVPRILVATRPVGYSGPAEV